MFDEVKDSGVRHENELGGNRDSEEGKFDYTFLPFIEFYRAMPFPTTERDELVKNAYDIYDNGLSEDRAKSYMKKISYIVCIKSETHSPSALASFGGEALSRLTKHYENGAKKYKRDNWKKLSTPSDIERLTRSMVRHAIMFALDYDDEDHLMASLWNMLTLLWHKNHGGSDENKQGTVQ